MKMKNLRLIAVSLALGSAVAACGGRTGAPSSPLTPSMPYAISFALPDKLPKHTIGEELPTEGVGSKKDPTWGKVGGFTQTKKAQVLAFPPGTTVTIRNLTKTDEHTLNVIGKAGKPPAHFPVIHRYRLAQKAAASSGSVTQAASSAADNRLKQSS